MLISISDQDARPIYQQIVSEIKEQIRQGVLCPGAELLSVRELADSLGINLHTVHRAYQQLRDEGVIHLRLGQRARVAALRVEPVSRDVIEARLVGRVQELVTEAFHLGLSPAHIRQLIDDILDSRQSEGDAR